MMHVSFATSTVAICIIVWTCRIAGLFADDLEAQFWAALSFAGMSFGIGTLMVEMCRSEPVNASLGRVLVGLSLCIMAAKAHEFMERAQACMLIANAQAKPVASEATYTQVTAVTPGGLEIDWSVANGRWDRSVPVVYRQRGAKGTGVGRGNGSIHFGGESTDCLPGRTSGNATITDAAF
jgi:hypothetical protein